MNHLTEEQLTEAYYGHMRPQHLENCPECRSSFDRLKEILDGMREYPIPERGAGYGAEVWSRLLPQLPPRKSQSRIRWWMLMPAFVALLAIAFVGGMLTQQRRQATAFAKARERVLLIAMSRHLERSQIVLADIANATPATIDLAEESQRARNLLDENRLLRLSAARSGDTGDAILLDELERVLLDVANSPPNLSTQDLANLQSRIEGQGLLFKVRVTSSDDRFKGQKL
jgi:hypothetical protein